MSYSFSVTASTKNEAGVKVEAELARIVGDQLAHAADRQAVQNAAEAFINVLAEPSETECIQVWVTGSLSWREENVFTNAYVSITASLKQKA